MGSAPSRRAFAASTGAGGKACAKPLPTPTRRTCTNGAKRVKDLWHASQLLRPAAPKRMKKLAGRAHRLSELLGDDHDLAVLRDRVAVNPGLFDDADSLRALLGAIDRRRASLQREALALGERLYKRPPKRFMRRFETDWRKRMG